MDMKRESFTAPFWILLITSAFNWLFYYFTFHMSLLRVRLPVLTIVLIFLWPSLLFIESILYWIIRKRIADRGWAWTHIILVLFGFVALRLIWSMLYYLR